MDMTMNENMTDEVQYKLKKFIFYPFLLIKNNQTFLTFLYFFCAFCHIIYESGIRQNG